MLSCNDFNQWWTEWHDGRLPEPNHGRMHMHMSQCPHCQAHHRQMQALLASLRTLSSPQALEPELPERLLTHARRQYGSKHSHQKQKVRYAAAAALFVGFMSGALFWAGFESMEKPQQPIAAANAVVLSLQTVKDVRLAVDSAEAIAEVRFTVELPEGVEIAGYPGLQRLSWQGQLQAGRNGLTLPLIARSTGQTGVLKARIEYEGHQQELVLPLTLPGDVSERLFYGKATMVAGYTTFRKLSS